MSTNDTRTAEQIPFPELHGDDEIGRPVRKAAPVEQHPFIVIQRDFPRVAEAIEMMWGSPELDNYFEKLIVADRGDREGFPKPVLAALLSLFRQHTNRFRFARPGDKWSHDPLARQAYRAERAKAIKKL